MSSPWNTKKYSMNNSSTARAINGELGIFQNKRNSQGAIAANKRENAKAGTFAFGAQVQSGRSITVKPSQKQKNLQFQSTQSGMMGNQSSRNNDQINTLESTFRTTIMNLASNKSEINGNLSPERRQKEIKRITSNLPEVYNKYFFTMGADQTSKVKLATAKDPMAETSPTHLGMSKGFSLNKTQKHSIRATDVANQDLLQTNETQKNNLKQYLDKGVFLKTTQGGRKGFRRKVQVDDETSRDNSNEPVNGIGRKHFASLASSNDEEDMHHLQEENKRVEIHLDASIESIGRRTQQEFAQNQDAQEIVQQRISALAKTADQGTWPKEFEYNEVDGQGDIVSERESHQTLPRAPSGFERLNSPQNLQNVAQPSVHSVSKMGSLKRADLPAQFQNTTLTGFRSQLGVNSDAPSCFCEKQGVCKKHATFEPTIESMIGLLEGQIGTLNKDEKSLDDNLDFIGKSMDTILLSRRDTFKEQITRAYAQKDEELIYFKKKCEEMEQNEALYQKSVGDREQLASQNLMLQKELNEVKNRSALESAALKSNYAKANSQIVEVAQSKSTLTEKHQSVQQNLSSAEEELARAKAELKKQQATIQNQTLKIEKLNEENELFRKYYVMNQADNRVEQTAEIDQVYSDFGKAFQLKDNFINRGMKDLEGIVNEHLKVENIYKTKQKRNLTDSGTLLPDDHHHFQNQEQQDQ